MKKHINITTFGRVRLFIVTAFLLVISNAVFAQVITNPGFELYTECPDGNGQMDRTIGWAQPTQGTCDYFNSCGYVDSFVSAQSGSGYVGGSTEVGGNDIKEYITNTLSTPLVAGITYTISFYATQGVGSLVGLNNVDLPVGERGYFGLCFSATAPTSANTSGSRRSINDDFAPFGRTFILPDHPYYTSHNNWVPVTLQYLAKGGEKYMTIGQFRPGLTSLPSGQINYYFVDGISETVAPNAILTKSISSPFITAGATATYTFSITNTTAGNVALSGLSFTDNLPSGLRIAANPGVNVVGLTGSGSVTATAGGNSVALSGYSIVGGGQATITLNVTNAPGQLNPTCTGNPGPFTNSATNISNLSLNLTNKITPVCLVVTAACGAGTTAPVFNNYVAADYYYLKTSSAYGIMCGGDATADLTVLVPSPAGPAGTTVTWHTGTPATDTNKLTSAEVAAFAGATKKVYAAFWDGVCYSPTKLITVYAPICATDDDFTATPIILGEGGILPSLFANDTYKTIILSTLPPNSVHWNGELWTHIIAEVDLVNAATYGALKIDASHPIGDHEYMYSINDNSPDATPGLSKSTAYVKFRVICKAGETAPIVNPSLSNLCPATTVNLDSAHTGTKSAGIDLVWFDSADTTTGTQLTAAQVASAGAGTYYAFYYSTLGNCYSPASSKVTVNITNCVTCSSGNNFVNLNSLYTGTHPDAPKTVLEWWKTADRTPGTNVTDPAKVTQSGTYYAFFYDTVNKCYNTENSTSAVLVTILPPCYCTNPGDLSVAGEPSKMGISVQKKESGWPENIPNGQIVLESREKGFVITRVAHVSFVPETTDSIAEPFAGMLVYDIQDACVKLFNGVNWNCIKRSCNDIGN